MTNQTESGPNESTSPSGPSVEELLEKKEEELDRFETRCALPAKCPIEVENEAKNLLTLTPEALKAMSAIQCGEAAFTLLQYGFFLQKAVNREQARLHLAEESRNKLAMKYIDQNSKQSFDERMKRAVAQHADVAEFDKVRVRALVHKSRIAFLEDKVKEMAHTLMSIQSTKRGVKS